MARHPSDNWPRCCWNSTCRCIGAAQLKNSDPQKHQMRFRKNPKILFTLTRGSCQAKKTIRKMLPVGLTESLSKIRSSIAYAISAIAQWDWPEQWPQLFAICMEALTCADQNAVHGAMRVLTGSTSFWLFHSFHCAQNSAARCRTRKCRTWPKLFYQKCTRFSRWTP